MLLGKRKFLPIFTTQFLGTFNDNLLKMAIITFITYHLDFGITQKGVLISLVSILYIVPFFLLSATAGQFADKFSREKLIRSLKVFELGFILFVTGAFFKGRYDLILIALVLLSVQSTFFGPVKYAILPQHLEEEELIEGNAFFGTSTYVAILFGTLFGTYVRSPQIILGILLVSSLLSLLCSFFILEAPAPRPFASLNVNILKDLQLTWKKISEIKVVNQTIWGLTWFWSLAVVVMILIYPLCEDVLGTSRNAVAVFLVIFSLGMGLGTYLCTKMIRGVIHPTYVPLSSLGMALSMFALYWATNSYIPPETNLHTVPFFSSFVGLRMALILFVLAFFSGMYVVPLNAFLQSKANKKYVATIMAGNNLLNALGIVCLSLFVMVSFKLGLSVPKIFFALAVVSIAVAFYILTMLPDALPRSIAQSILALIFKVDVKGLENFEKAGKRVLIVANHTSLLDGLLLASFMPEKLIFAINTNVAQKWWVKLFTPVVKLHPLDPTNPLALKNIIDALKENQKCIIFPEGRITVTGSLMKVYEGAGVVAHTADANILPIRIDGAQFSKFSYLKSKLKTKYFPKITMTVLAPRKIKVQEGMGGAARRREISTQLYKIMSSMMYESSPVKTPLYDSLLRAKKTYGAGFTIAEDIARKPVNYKQFILKTHVLGMHFETSIPEERVALMLPNSVATAVSFFALHEAGKVPAMLNFTQGEAQILSCLKTAEIATVISSKKMVSLMNLESLVTSIRNQGIKILYLEDLADQISLKTKIKGMYRNIRNYSPKTDSSDVAAILFTSGSEGVPKAVALSHENLQSNRYQMTAVYAFNSSDTFFNMLPMFHSFGLGVGTVLPILTGMRVFFYPSPVHYKIVPELVYDTSSTIICGTDTFFQGYAKQADPYDFYNLRYAIVGAEKLKESTAQLWMEKFGVRIFEGYGITETSPVLSVNTPMYMKKGSVGKLLPGIEHKLEPVEGVAEGGRLFVKGGNIMKGYLKDGQIFPVEDGWYDTGDIVSVDEAGYVTIQGRAKRFAKIGGEMVSLTAVEEIISQKYPDQKSVVIALQDPKRGEQLVLVTDGEGITSKDLLAYFRDKQYSELWIPKKIHTKFEIPMLGTGKTNYVKLKEMLDK